MGYNIVVNVSYDYYKDEYKGNMDEETFLKFVRRAYVSVDSFCFGRLANKSDTDFNSVILEHIKDCICDVADKLYTFSNDDGVSDVGIKASETVGPWSVSYSSSSLPSSVEHSIRRSCLTYLSCTGLMCSWV